MSVVKSKRGVGKLVALTKATEVAKYTLQICSNEKCFPKRQRWSLASYINKAAIGINTNLTIANAIYVKTERDFEMRREYQTKALATTYALLSMIDIAYATYGIESRKIEYWTQLVCELQALIRNWKKSDAESWKRTQEDK